MAKASALGSRLRRINFRDDQFEHVGTPSLHCVALSAGGGVGRFIRAVYTRMGIRRVRTFVLAIAGLPRGLSVRPEWLASWLGTGKRGGCEARAGRRRDSRVLTNWSNVCFREENRKDLIR